jgi:hypothetical protein
MVKARSPPLQQWRSFVYCEAMAAGQLLGEVDHFPGAPLLLLLLNASAQHGKLLFCVPCVHQPATCIVCSAHAAAPILRTKSNAKRMHAQQGTEVAAHLAHHSPQYDATPRDQLAS